MTGVQTCALPICKEVKDVFKKVVYPNHEVSEESERTDKGGGSELNAFS